MGPNRAAWLFVAGLAWLVLRGILAHVFGWANAGEIAQHGGLAMLLPAISLVASLTMPLFFFSFLTHHPFEDRVFLRGATVLALAASLISFLLVLVSFVAILLEPGSRGAVLAAVPSWIVTAVPLLFVFSIFLFLVAFAQTEGKDSRLRRAAVVGAVGTLIPLLIILGWIIHTRVAGALGWYPDFSQSLVAKGMGLAAAGTLLWFLETFAVSYDE